MFNTWSIIRQVLLQCIQSEMCLTLKHQKGILFVLVLYVKKKLPLSLISKVLRYTLRIGGKIR